MTNNTVLRGGYGIFYSEAQGQEIQGELNSPPLVITQSVVGAPQAPADVLVDQMFPPAAAAKTGTIAPFTVDPSDRTPYLQQWNLGVQQTFGKSYLVETAYVGSRGLKLGRPVQPEPSGPRSEPCQSDSGNITRAFPGMGKHACIQFRRQFLV